jgi:hypothetical protein
VNDNRRTWEIIGGFILLIVGLGAFGSDFFPAMVLILLGGALLWRQWGKGNLDISSVFRPQETTSYEDDDTLEPSRQSGAEKVYAHALRAVQRAGLNPDEVRVLPVDIGVMVFKGDLDPQVFRTHDVPDDADYIQPFVQLRLPTRATGRIKFEIIDSDGQRVFVHEDMHQLDRGRNLISPSARLPVHDAQAMHREWTLRVSADGVVLATHTFFWEESETKRVRRHLTEDGEISNELRAALAENRLGKVSLDELLDFQEEDEPQQKQQRR